MHDAEGSLSTFYIRLVVASMKLALITARRDPIYIAEPVQFARPCACDARLMMVLCMYLLDHYSRRSGAIEKKGHTYI